jgi:hypothetical protein
MTSTSVLNWQMTGFFLVALTLLIFAMRLVAMWLAVGSSPDRWWVFWLLPSPNSLRRLRPAVDPWRLLLRTGLWFAAVCLGYRVFGWLVGAGRVRGLWVSYAALPILLSMMEFLSSLITALMLPSGELFPSVHGRPVLARGIADFWAHRWNLWFSDWFRSAVLTRLRRRPASALVLIFAISGAMHEWVINVPLYGLTGRARFGSMMIYFLLQAAGLLLERRFLKDRDGLKRAFAWLVIVAPAPLVMNEGLLRTLHLWPE